MSRHSSGTGIRHRCICFVSHPERNHPEEHAYFTRPEKQSLSIDNNTIVVPVVSQRKPLSLSLSLHTENKDTHHWTTSFKPLSCTGQSWATECAARPASAARLPRVRHSFMTAKYTLAAQKILVASCCKINSCNATSFRFSLNLLTLYTRMGIS